MGGDRVVVCAADWAPALRRVVLPGVDVLALGAATGSRYGTVVVLAEGLTAEQWGWVRTLARPEGRVRDCGAVAGEIQDAAERYVKGGGGE